MIAPYIANNDFFEIQAHFIVNFVQLFPLT